MTTRPCLAGDVGFFVSGDGLLGGPSWGSSRGGLLLFLLAMLCYPRRAGTSGLLVKSGILANGPMGPRGFDLLLSIRH